MQWCDAMRHASMRFWASIYLHHQIKTLLSDPQPAVQSMGAQLMASFIRAQSAAENQFAAVEDLMGSHVVRLGLAAVAAKDEDYKAAFLICIREYILLCNKLKALSQGLSLLEGIHVSRGSKAIVYLYH